jgi:hypothetical protein
MRGRLKRLGSDERGMVVLLVAMLLVAFLGFAALVVDLGILFVIRGELQNAADAAALAGVVELVDSDVATAQATAIAYATDPGNYHLTQPPPGQDAVTVTVIDSETLEVRVRRASGTASGPVPTYFAPILGINSADIEVVAVAQIERDIIGTGPGNLLPFGVAESLVDADGDGEYDLGALVDIYPHDYAPGNFGLLDLNGGSNPTPEIRDWIENGYDDYFIIPEDPGYTYVEGMPGIRGNSFSSSLSQRLGDKVLFAVFDQVTGQGGNTQYRVVDLVGGIIEGFKLTGPQDKRYINVRIVQFTKENLIAGSGANSPNNSVALPKLIQ